MHDSRSGEQGRCMIQSSRRTPQCPDPNLACRRHVDATDSTRPRPLAQGLAMHVMMFQVLVVVTCVCVVFASPASVTVTTATSSSTTSTTTASSGCDGLVRCSADPQCASCLEAINNTDGFPHTLTEYFNLDLAAQLAYQSEFFQALQSSVPCSTTSQDILSPALQELERKIPCIDRYRMVMDYCTVPEYTCFADNDCRHCLDDLIAVGEGNGTNAQSLRSPACIATDRSLLNDLANQCIPFPTCTYYKMQCNSSTECSFCLATLRGGDGAGAARQCRGPSAPSALAMNNVVNYCTDSNSVACDFWHQRCSGNMNCSGCLADMGDGDSVSAMTAALSTPVCRSALRDSVATYYLGAMTSGCPGISTCRLAIFNCIAYFGDVCTTCLNVSAPPPNDSSLCSRLSQQFSFDTACQSCPASVHIINMVVVATAVVGGVSAAACILVAITIVAHGRDRVSMRDRIVIGLMLTNSVYSTANTIPFNALHNGVLDCGRLVMSFEAIRFGQAWWFCGKYGLVTFELFILGASIRALRRGATVMTACAEAAIHGACYTVALSAFVVFYTLCVKINDDGYNTSTEDEAFSNAYNYVSANDDLDDSVYHSEPSIAASERFEHGRNEYDKLIRYMLLAWDVLAGMAILLWTVLRLMYRYALRALLIEVDTAAQAEAVDVWAVTRRSVWGAQRHLLEARREAFKEVAKPLEPYIAVFVVFAVPAFVMSTSFCRDNSGATSGGTSSTVGGAGATTTLTYGTCDVWCEFVLAFRSLCTVVVYLLSRERRAEFVAVRSTWKKLCNRVAGCLRCTAERASPDRRELHEMYEPLYQHPSEDTSSLDMLPAASGTAMHILENDVKKVRVLGRGSFGEVWEGLLDDRRVAIKIMLSGVVDDDGFVVHPHAHEDFHRECEVLQRIDSPHLLKFYGAGTTASGDRFIVTELLAGGSLEDVLHDPQRDLPWHTRMKIALQIAIGMKHLHEMNMLHRDLKSANVVLDEEFRAKVCDFGLTRVVKPHRQRVVHSPFTGVTRLLPAQASDDKIDNEKQWSSLTFENIAVNVMDAHGTMTKAVGTLLWMAPEVYRGDRNYTGAVDVYSYGIMLWELATRRTPWVDEMSHEMTFFEQLNRALQTGRRPTIPDDVVAEHSEFVVVMQRCWAGDPADRPTFAEVSKCFFLLSIQGEVTK